MASLVNWFRSPAAVAKEQKSALERNVRALEAEQRSMEREGERLLSEAKAAAKRGRLDEAKLKAKRIAQTRRHAMRYANLAMQLREIASQITVATSTHMLGESMRNAAAVMRQVNSSLNPMGLRQTVVAFEKQTSELATADEMLQDTLDGALGSEDNEAGEDSDEIVDKIMAEICAGVAGTMAQPPAEAPRRQARRSRPQASAASADAVDNDNDGEDARLEERLERLRRT